MAWSPKDSSSDAATGMTGDETEDVMPQHRPAESRKARSWSHDVANENELSKIRPWAYWGEAAPPEQQAEDDLDQLPGDSGNDLAWEIAIDSDPDWAARRDDDSFVMVVEAEEDDVISLVEDDGRVQGYAPYLMDARRGPTAR
jgi:hypothetical protein